MIDFDNDDTDFIWQQQLEEQQRKEIGTKSGGLVDWDIMESIFMTPYKYEVRPKEIE
jgi:hypothetical protein